MQTIEISENGIYLVFEVTKERELKFLHFSPNAFQKKDINAKSLEGSFHLAEVELAGFDRPFERHGTKYIVTAPGCTMKYEKHLDFRNENGRKLEFTTRDPETNLVLTSHLQFYDGISIVRSWSEIKNEGSKKRTCTYLSSFHYNGVEKEGILPRDEKMFLSIPHNSWQRELNWQTYSLPELGIAQSQPNVEQRSSKAIGITNTGNWSTKEYIPMGFLENREIGSVLFWQIEHNGSWHWEISDQTAHLYLALSGPTETESHWYKDLAPGESFISVPVAVGTITGKFQVAMGELTKYRRAIRRKNKDNELLGVIFNDYMNCLWADPTTEKELPLIDAACEAGCEYFCIDAGWYSKGFWWDQVGEWKESRERFPNGLKEVTDYIRYKGMIPGVWLELEAMGIRCPIAENVSEDWFFVRHGERVFDRSRFQLDFDTKEVRDFATETIDRLIRDYGVGYIKMDYNIEPGIGTEKNGRSAGEGLLAHERAYLKWLDSIFEKYPDLIIENCSSGGLRMDYAMLSRYSIQSTSDQDDYRRYATIAANAPSALTPEQAAIWSYPMTEGDKEEVVFNMINSMLLRIHQSGHLANLSKERAALVKEGIQCYKKIRDDIKDAVPIWPLGLSEYKDPWVCLGLKSKNKVYLAIWRRNSETSYLKIPLEDLEAADANVKCIYPSYQGCDFKWNPGNSTLSVDFPVEMSARLFELTLK